MPDNQHCIAPDERRWLGGWLKSHAFGLSASSLAAHVLTGEPPKWRPLDHGDLGRCESLYRSAPATAQAIMQPLIEEYRDEVWAKYPARACGRCNLYGTPRLVPNHDTNTWMRCPDCDALGWFDRDGNPTRKVSR